MDQSDPFLEAADDLKTLFEQSRVLYAKINSTSFVTVSDFQKMQSFHNDAKELLNILKDAFDIVAERGGRVNDQIINANELVQRQSILRSFENDMEQLSKSITFLESRQRSAQERDAAAASANADARQDDYVVEQQHAQVDEIARQEEVMDRLSHGIQELKRTGLNIGEELHTGNELLADVDTSVTSVQARLVSANQKLDRLLASLSNSHKLLIILVLLGIILVLYILF